jgi:hypothetical protein
MAPKQSFTGLLACAEDFSPTRLLDANRVTLRYALAIPIRAETCILMKVRKPHDKESEKTSHDENEQDAYYVSARRVPQRPSHLSIHEHIRGAPVTEHTHHDSTRPSQLAALYDPKRSWRINGILGAALSGGEPRRYERTHDHERAILKAANCNFSAAANARALLLEGKRARCPLPGAAQTSQIPERSRFMSTHPISDAPR